MKERKKILLFIDWFYPGFKAGGPIQSCINLIDHLKEDFDFSVVTRNTDYCETEPYPAVRSDQWNVLPNGFRVYYFSKENLNKKNIQRLLTNETYDFVYLNGIFSLYFTLIPLFLLRKKKNKTLIAVRGMLAKSALSIKKEKKYLFLFTTKFFGLFNNVHFHATKEEEIKDIRSVFGSKAIIKLAYNLPKKMQDNQLARKEKKQGSVRIVNIARIAPEKNLKYALHILSNVNGNVELDIYGPIYDKIYWEECKQTIKSLPESIKVNYKNSIESNLIPDTLKNYHFMFMPTQGENFGHIIIESLRVGCPVIISDQTIWKNLQNENAGWDLSLSKEEEYTKIIEQTIKMSQEEYLEMSQGAFNFAKNALNKEKNIAANKLLFQ